MIHEFFIFPDKKRRAIQKTRAVAFLYQITELVSRKYSNSSTGMGFA